MYTYTVSENRICIEAFSGVLVAGRARMDTVRRLGLGHPGTGECIGIYRLLIEDGNH